MKRIIVKYKVKEEKAQENIDFIKKVFAGLERTKPNGLKYASFRLDDGLSFVHIVSIETEDGSNPLVLLDEFKEFTKDIKSRCDEPPTASEVETIGDFRLFQ